MKAKLRIFLLFTLVSVLITSCSLGKQSTNNTPTEVPVVKAPTGIVVEGRIVPAQNVDLAFVSSGKVSEVMVKKGDLVKKGDVLARLGNREPLEAAISNAELELLNAQQALIDLDKKAEAARIDAEKRISAATKAYRDAQYNLDNFTVPQNQKNMDAIQAVIAMRQKLAEVRAIFDKYKYLSENDPNRKDAKEKLDQAQADYNAAVRRLGLEFDVKTAQAQLDQATRDFDEVKDGPRAEDKASAEARIKAAEAALASAKAALSQLDLIATIDGTVVDMDLIPGKQVNAFQKVLTLADFSKLYVETDNLTEIEVVDVTEGESVTITADALPEKVLSGKVDWISKLYEEKRGDITYTVRVLLAETDPQLRWGMTVVINFEKK